MSHDSSQDGVNPRSNDQGMGSPTGTETAVEALLGITAATTRTEANLSSGMASGSSSGAPSAQAASSPLGSNVASNAYGGRTAVYEQRVQMDQTHRPAVIATPPDVQRRSASVFSGSGRWTPQLSSQNSSGVAPLTPARVSHSRITPSEVFSKPLKNIHRVNGTVLSDTDKIATERLRSFARGIKLYEVKSTVRNWVKTFVRAIKLSGLANNPRLIMQTLLDKINADTPLGSGIHDKYDSLQEQLCATMRNRGMSEEDALRYSLGNEATESYVCTLLDHALVAKAAKLNESHLDDKWNALRMKRGQSLQAYFARMETLCVNIRAIGGYKSPEEQVKALLKGLPDKTEAKDGGVPVSLPGEARKEQERAARVGDAAYVQNPVAYLQMFLQNQVTNFRLKLKISDDDSDDEEDQSEEDTGRLPKKVRYTGTPNPKSTTKDEKALRKLVERIPASEMDSRPCALCNLIPGREQYGNNHSASICWQNPNSPHFEPKPGYDRAGNKRASKNRKDKGDKKRKRAEAETPASAPDSKKGQGDGVSIQRMTRDEWKAQEAKEASERAAEFERNMKEWSARTDNVVVPRQEYDSLIKARRLQLGNDPQERDLEWNGMSKRNQG